MTATSAQEPAIRVHGLTKSYSELDVLRGVDFEVARGSIFALLGSNGAGKTTVVKIVSTLLKADAGEVTVKGFEVAGQGAEVRKSISLTGSSRPSTRFLACGRTWCWWPGCGTSTTRGPSPMGCSSASDWLMRPRGRCRPTPVGCAAAWTSR
jgi:ABC-type dipeptide/oligopeptide/nickel transport system ATPase component